MIAAALCPLKARNFVDRGREFISTASHGWYVHHPERLVAVPRTTLGLSLQYHPCVGVLPSAWSMLKMAVVSNGRLVCLAPIADAFRVAPITGCKSKGSRRVVFEAHRRLQTTPLESRLVGHFETKAGSAPKIQRRTCYGSSPASLATSAKAARRSRTGASRCGLQIPLRLTPPLKGPQGGDQTAAGVSLIANVAGLTRHR